MDIENNKSKYLNKESMIKSLEIEESESPSEKNNIYMPNKYVFDMDYKTMYEQAMNKIKKLEEKKEKNKKNKDGEQSNEFYTELLRENAKLKEGQNKEIEEYKITINKLNNTINKLTEQVKELSKNSKNNISVENSREYKDLLKEFNDFKNSFNIDYDKQNPDNNKDIELNKIKKEYENKIENLESKLNNKNDININEIREKLKKEIESEYKQKKNSQKSENSEKYESRNKKMKNKNLNIMERYPVKKINNVDNEIFKFVASEDTFLIKYQYDICRKLDKSVEEITFDDIFDFKVSYGDLSDTPQERSRFKNKLRRCKHLYNIYEDKLNNFKISLYYLSSISENDWSIWKKEFHKLILELYPEFKIDENKNKICQYVFKSGKKKGDICGKYECTNKYHI